MEIVIGIDVQVNEAQFLSESTKMMFDLKLAIGMSKLEEKTSNLVVALNHSPREVGRDLLKVVLTGLLQNYEEAELVSSRSFADLEVDVGFGLELMAAQSADGSLILMGGGAMEVVADQGGLTASDLLKISSPALAGVLAAAGLQLLFFVLCGLRVSVDFEGLDDDGEPEFVFVLQGATSSDSDSGESDSDTAEPT